LTQNIGQHQGQPKQQENFFHGYGRKGPFGNSQWISQTISTIRIKRIEKVNVGFLGMNSPKHHTSFCFPPTKSGEALASFGLFQCFWPSCAFVHSRGDAVFVSNNLIGMCSQTNSGPPTPEGGVKYRPPRPRRVSFRNCSLPFTNLINSLVVRLGSVSDECRPPNPRRRSKIQEQLE